MQQNRRFFCHVSPRVSVSGGRSPDNPARPLDSQIGPDRGGSWLRSGSIDAEYHLPLPARVRRSGSRTPPRASSCQSASPSTDRTLYSSALGWLPLACAW